MKTTLDLPDHLMMQVKLRALQEGRKLKDTIADLLRKGLHARTEAQLEKPTVRTDRRSGLPVIVCKHEASAGNELTPQRVADVLLAQEVEWHHVSGR